MTNELDINQIFEKPPTQAELDEFFSGRDPAWHRAARGAYSAPHDWWVTWVHLSMLSGAWGSKYQSSAQINQQRLNLVLEEALMLPNKMEVFWNIAKIVGQYQKAYMVGRIASNTYVIGQPTKKFIKRWPPFFNSIAKLGNFGVLSFGSGILATAKGLRRVEDVIPSMITGDIRPYPRLKNNPATVPSGKFTAEFINKYVEVIEEANDFDPSSPISYDEWCRKNPQFEKTVSFCQ